MFRDTPWLYLGPLGALRRLPCPDTGWSQDQEVIGGEHESLTGRRTRFVQAYRRTWHVDFPNLFPRELALIEAAHMNLDNEPLYLVDPLRVNRLDRWLSTGGAERASAQSATAVGSAVLEVGAEAPTEAPTGRCVRLRSVDTDSGMRGTTANPVVPGETLTLSAYVRSDTACVLHMSWQDADGAELATADSEPSDTGDWVQMSVTDTAPDNAAEVVVSLTATAEATNIYTTGWQLSREEGHPWVPGTGSPEVYVSEVETETPVYPLVTASVKFKEV